MSKVVQHVKFASGERHPILLGEDRMPLWYPTLFCTIYGRNASKAANTLEFRLRHIGYLLDWSEIQQVDIVARVLAGRLDVLSTAEIESLADSLGRRRRLRAASDLRQKHSVRRSKNHVDLPVKYNRISTVAVYLRWFICRFAEDHRCFSNELQVSACSIAEHLKSLRPLRSQFKRLGQRQGLTEQAYARLSEIVSPQSNLNPFEPALRRRNALVVRLMIDLGVRLGELLSLKITDFDLHQNEVTIARRADDPDDLRVPQPVAKTFDRVLPMSESLAADIWAYISKDRRAVPGSGRHAFLFVVHAEGEYRGKPITRKGIDKVFAALRAIDSKLLSGLTAHVLRHTSNDEFSDLMDHLGVKSADEERQREYKYGWAYGSGTAAIYTRRHTERKAQEASLKLQAKLHGKTNK